MTNDSRSEQLTHIHTWLPYYYDGVTARGSGGHYASYVLNQVYCHGCGAVEPTNKGNHGN